MKHFVLMFFLFTIIRPAYADETFDASSSNVVAAADAYARAAGLEPTASQSGIQIRIWMRDYMFGSIQGVVVSNDSLRRFESISTYSKDKISVRPAQIGQPKKLVVLPEIEEIASQLPPYDRAFISCDVEDGGSVVVDSQVNGRRTIFQVDNPRACEDKASKLVVNLLDLLLGK